MPHSSKLSTRSVIRLRNLPALSAAGASRIGDGALAESLDDEAEPLEQLRMRDEPRAIGGIELDDLGRQHDLALDAALGALALQALIDQALMGGVLIDDDEAVRRLGHDIGLVQLGARRAERMGLALGGRGLLREGGTRVDGSRRPRRVIECRLAAAAEAARRRGAGRRRGPRRDRAGRRRRLPHEGPRCGCCAKPVPAENAAKARSEACATGLMPALRSASWMALTTSALTSPASRKRTSALAGCTFTSTARGSTSR